MALPQDGQDANSLTKVTQIPAGKELMFIDPTTNEGGIITLEDLTKQILNGLASQAFALDAGQMTLPAALNYLYGKSIFNDVKQPGTYSFPIKQNSCMLVVLQTSTTNNTPVYVVSRYYADICIQLLTGGREDTKASVKNEQLVITLRYSSCVIIYSF
ncbi:hypothetical protein [Ruminococcus sp. RTP21358st1_G6_RTP21358_211008]|uniref:hypothetical protein n=1 Tax=Ruminococcus sp. RTP21358st1_G6_RTP21358_211008 TaxID=3141605 RepID=UPI0034A3A9AC